LREPLILSLPIESPHSGEAGKRERFPGGGQGVTGYPTGNDSEYGETLAHALGLTCESNMLYTLVAGLRVQNNEQ
jgi:hypothetical protein